MHRRTGLILQTAVAEQHQHDITLARQQIKDLPLGTVCLADLGYQGLELTGARVLLPFKTPRQGVLPDQAKRFNQAFARHRVTVEHRIRTLKVFRVLAERYRGRRQRFELRLQLIAALTNRAPHRF